MPSAAPYGSWTSPLTPASFSQGNCTAVCELEATDDGVFWTEQSCSTGRRSLLFQSKDGRREEWAKGHSVQSYVHEYGGGSFNVTPEGGVVFSTSEGLFGQSSSDHEPVLLRPSNGNTVRFADFSVTSTHIFAVQELHSEDGSDPENRLVSVSRRTKETVTLASGADFYAFPRVSPDGRQLVWMQWNHINMPWDETSIHMGDVQPDGRVQNCHLVKSGAGLGVNYNCPGWSPRGELLLVNDKTNWWNVYRLDASDENCSCRYKETNLHPVDREIGHACWILGDRRYATSGEKTLLRVDDELVLLEEGETRRLHIPGFKQFTHLSVTTSGEVYCIAAGPEKSSSLLRISELESEEVQVEVIREARRAEDLEQFDISLPEKMSFYSDGETVHGYFYQPMNRDFAAPEGSLPPVILMGHGGPTECARPVLDLRKQFFTSRGFAIFDVDYRGSTGYGTRFRNLLKKQNGVLDRDDMINGARMLVSSGRVDPEKVCIMGQSAGGFLVLNCLVASDIFRSAVSICGVADIAALAVITEKFERCYNEVLIGKYPEEQQLYFERTPSNHMEKITAAVAFIHGREDKVVPVSQSETMFEQLKARGVTTALQVYEGEGHGFRKAEAVRRYNEDSYYFLCRTLGIEPSVTSTTTIFNEKVIK